MLFMVTNRRRERGEYGDNEQSGHRYDYLYEHLNGPRNQDGFAKRSKRGFEAALMKEMIRLRDEKNVGTPKVGIYLHGFNNNYQESIDELVDFHENLSKQMKYEPILVGFSWPSAGRTVEYLSDREEVRDSIPAFTRFLRDIHDFLLRNERECFCTTYCVAHSMGNYLLRKGMEYLSDHLGTPVGRAMFNETVMLAPDLASKDIELDGKGQYIGEFSRRVHVYYSRYDRALKASSAKRFGGNRLGRRGADDYRNVGQNIVFVNSEEYANGDSMKATGVKTRWGKDVSVHGAQKYHPTILADIEQTLSSVDRDLIETRKPDRKLPDDSPMRENHYVLKPQDEMGGDG